MEDHVLKDVRRHIFCILSSAKLFCPSWEEDTSGQSEVWAGEDTSGHSEVRGKLRSAPKHVRVMAKSLQRQKNYLGQCVEF